MKNDIVQKHVYNKIPNIRNLASSTTLNAKVNEVKNEISSIINLATNASLNTKAKEVKCEILGVTNLATTAAFTTVENKIPNFNDLVKKTYYDPKMSEIEKKYFSTSYYNKFTSNTLDAK